jgi:soluble lytic murein transglycosylase
MAVSFAPAAVHDADEWWTERRLSPTKLSMPATADCVPDCTYAAVPERKARVEHQFTAGWIAFRFQRSCDRKAALRATIEVAEHPASMARGYYWYARTCGRLARMPRRAHYERAARRTYYGQIAHARLGRAAPACHPAAIRRPAAEIVRDGNVGPRRTRPCRIGRRHG